MPKVGDQIAALAMKWDREKAIQVLMITSRDTGRWVMPKGWEMDGKKPWRAAEIEALEEAGAVGHIGSDLLGTYTYDKILKDGSAQPCLVRVYPLLVDKLKRNWKERKERKRRWFSPAAAAKRVAEPELAQLLRSLEDDSNRRAEVFDWFKDCA
ncbi:NUDIX hydrolase [Sagittula sp. SSi028]|uniref:NUDIX hydrolase n=1 Tax=Sagittula sp. SSi028 TaxID=3400636 RepID=UPI003AF6189B